MTPEEWAKWFRDKFPKEPVEDLIIALRSATKYGFWHSPLYAEDVIKYLEKMT